MSVLPVPPVVSQLNAVNPDGSVDPAATTDCGEACAASALRGFGKLQLSPGCIRQAIGDPVQNGRTVGGELERVFRQSGLVATVSGLSGDALWKALRRLRRHGRYCLILGAWIEPDQLHWRLLYERDALNVSFMDPWTGGYGSMGEATVLAKGADSQVWVIA